VFYGSSRHTLDAKNRVHLPKRFLDLVPQAEWKFFLTPGLEECLFLFDQPRWERMVGRLQPDEVGGPELRLMHRSFFANVAILVPDSQGRVVIPDYHKTFAGLKSDLSIMGLHNRIEIWSTDRWERYEKDNKENFELFGNQLLSGVRGELPR
jgi:MraZ protein